MLYVPKIEIEFEILIKIQVYPFYSYLSDRYRAILSSDGPWPGLIREPLPSNDPDVLFDAGAPEELSAQVRSLHSKTKRF